MARKKKDRRRRRGRFAVVYKLLSFVLIITAMGAGCISFFRVNRVEVTGNDRYAPQEIIDAAGVKEGEYLFLIDRTAIREEVLRQLPYVERVTPHIHLPDTLELEVVESPSLACIQAEGAWWLINVDGKVQATGTAADTGTLPEILGLSPEGLEIGVGLTVPEEEQSKLDRLCSLLRALADWDLAERLQGFIDVSSASVIRCGYGEGLTVIIPASGDMERQVYALRRVMETFAQRGEVVTGTLDLSYSEDEARLRLEQWRPEGWAEREVSGDEQSDGSDTGAEPGVDGDTVPVGGADQPAAAGEA